MGKGILLYSPHLSERLIYSARFILEELLSLDLSFTSTIDKVNSFPGPVINYSKTDINSTIKIVPAGLLEETGIRKQQVSIGSWRYVPAIFITSHSGAINFDIFSATFYFLCRYEEYLWFSHDSHGRFPANISLAFRNGFLEIPVVNLWANKLGDLLNENYKNLNINKKSFTWQSTIDVDTAWAILNRNLIQTAGGLIKSLISEDDFLTRIRVLKGKEEDPYYTFDFLKRLHSDDPGKLMFFFLSGKPGGLDRNVSPENKNWQELVKKLSEEYKIGLHPSYKSKMDLNILRKEYKMLSSIISKPVTHSRQHFLLLRFPDTYRNLIDTGIENDYSMGFADHTGFRAGTCTPFYFYDLEKEHVTGLKIWPFMMMDRTLMKYMGLNQEESRRKITALIDTVVQSGGTFISLWHNDTLSNYRDMGGWREVYAEMVNYLNVKRDT